MSQKAILAFDLGATSGRAVLGTYDGKRLKTEGVHRFLNQPVMMGGTLCWDFPRLFFEIKQGICKARQKAQTISSIGIDTWGVDFGLIDDAGRLISNPTNYRDKRYFGVMEKAFKKIPQRKIFFETGIQFLPFNTVYQLYALKLEGSFELSAARHLLMLPDLFIYFLSGALTSEFTHCSTSQLVSPKTRNWHRKMIDRLGLPSKIFPEIIQPGTVIGGLRPEVAKELGARGTKLIAVAEHDTASAVASVPAKGKNWAYISAGTWFLLGAEVKNPVISQKCYDYRFGNEGGVFGTWRLLKNIAGFWFLEQAKLNFERELGKPISYPQLLKEAELAKPGLAVIDVDAPEFLNPADMVIAIQKHCREHGFKVPKPRGEIVRVIFESIIQRCKEVLEQLEEITGERYDRVHMVGGGARNHLFCKWLASAIGREVIAGPEEATAIGNLAMQLIACRELKSHAEARQLIVDSISLENFFP
jgi:rhamnulokinase